MPLYTIIMDYAGGTYIYQVKAKSPKLAAVKWAQNLNADQITGFGNKSKGLLVEKMKDDPPVPLNGILNVWCSTALIRNKLALIDIVQTEEPNIAKMHKES